MKESEIRLNKILLFDGSHALHRNLSEPNNYKLKNNNGKRTGGIIGVLKTILKELKKYGGYPVVIFDGGLAKHRLDAYPNYKKNLEKRILLENKQKQSEQELINKEYLLEYKTQRDDLIEILPLFGIPAIKIDGCEGDDLLFTLSKVIKKCIIVSDDKDLMQLIHKDALRECKLRRAMGDELLDINYFIESNITVNDFLLKKVICGDNSDNIPRKLF